MGESGAGSRITVGVDRLSKQRNLPHALQRETPDVLDDVGQGPAALGAAHERDDAETADLVAAEDRRHVRSQAMLQHSAAGLRRVSLVLPLEILDEGLVLTHIEAVIEVGEPLEEAVLLTVRHATGHRDRPSRPALFPTFELAETAVGFLLGVLPHRAGDQDGDVSLIDIANGRETGRGQALGQVIGVRLVHLAAADPEVEALAGRGMRPPLSPRPREAMRLEG